MIKKLCLIYCLAFLWLSGCTKKETQNMDIKGDLTGKVKTFLEYGLAVNDYANIAVTLTGSDIPMVYTDTAGNYTLKNIPLGNYSLSFSKEGYGTYLISNFLFIGKDTPQNTSLNLWHKSSTRITGYNLSFSRQYLHFSGTITHVFPKSVMNVYPYDWPGMSIYLSDSANVSPTNYEQILSFNSNQNISTNFTDSVYIYNSLYHSGSKIYAIIYGHNALGFQLYDYEKGIYYDPCIGEPSEVKSIIVH